MGNVLEAHGTRLQQLKPGSIVDAARADLRRRLHNRGGREGACEHYCFHRSHVRKAENAADLIARALDDRERGCSSGKRVTRLVYGDQLLLAAALVAAQQGRGNAERPTPPPGERDVVAAIFPPSNEDEKSDVAPGAAG